MNLIKLLALFCFFSLAFCFNGSMARQRIICDKSDTLYFNQICIDTICLPIYEPTAKGRSILDKILNTKHQNFIKFPEGTFEILEEKKSNTVLTILFLDRNIHFFAQYGWNSFKGVVYYKEQIFLIRDSVKDENIDMLFEYSGQREGFPEYSDKLYVKIDEKVIWKFNKREDKFYFMSIYPPSNIIDFDPEIFE